MKVFSVLTVLFIVTNTLANKTEANKEDVNLKDSKFQEIDALTTTAEATDEIKRAKKSATTTFCVEIRPSGPSQKPFQVCEPTEPAAEPVKPPQQPTSGHSFSAYYTMPSYEIQDQAKPEAYSASNTPVYKPPSLPKTGAVYSAPPKVYSAPKTQPPKQYPAHGMPYSSYRSKSEESEVEEHGHLMKMSHDIDDEDTDIDSEMVSSHRTESYGLTNYESPYYGELNTYVPVSPKKSSEKHEHHNGLVITCQPNLAGYAHNVPSSLHHPPAVPHYSYRLGSPKEYNRRYRYQQTYGNYEQPHPYKSVANGYKNHQMLKPPAPAQQYTGYGARGYAPPTSIYSAPPPPQAPPQPPAQPAYASPPHPAQVHHTHLTPYPQHAKPSYGPPPQAPPPPRPNYSVQPPQAPSPYPPQTSPPLSPNYPSYAPAPPPPSPAQTAPPPQPTYGSAPGYASAPPATFPSYPQAPSYPQNPSVPGPSPPPAQQAQDYVPPGTYREAEDEADSTLRENKEKHTLEKMEEMSNQRAVGTQWSTEMAQDNLKNSKNDVNVGSPGWSPKKGPNRIEVDQKEEDKVK